MMEVFATYTGVEIEEAEIPFSSMPAPQPLPLQGNGNPRPLDFVILKPNGAEETEELFLRTYYEENNLRPATGFELATLRKKLWQKSKGGDFSREATQELSSLSQTIALGDQHQNKFVFVADGFWDYMLSDTEMLLPHFKIAAVKLVPI